MAKLSSDKTYVTVEKGDNLWQIAKTYGNGLSYKQLASMNNISNPSLIYVGQIIKLSSVKSSSKPVSTSSKPGSTVNRSVSASNQSSAVVDHFGFQSDSDNTLFATWIWGRDHTKNYEVEWSYTTNDFIWFIGNRSTTDYKQSTYSIPSNATYVRFRVRPISTTYSKNNRETSYWTASWSKEKLYYVGSNPPVVPSAPTVTIENYKLTARVDNLHGDIHATGIQFQIIKDDHTIFKTGEAKIITEQASYSCSVIAGSRYKVRCRSYRGPVFSHWSEYSSNVGTAPAASKGILTLRALSATSVLIDWANVSNAKSYEVEYTTKKMYFDSSSEVQSITIDATAAGHAEITGLESGQQYFFRVRAVNDDGKSAWTEIKSIIIGKAPSAPTTWSSVTTCIIGDPLTLYWVHNSEDGSSQTYAQLELYVNGVKNTYTIKNTTDEDEKDKTSSYVVDTSKFTEGTKIQWRVRTEGITNVYGDWSIQRTIDIYAPPTLELSITNSEGASIETLESFPFYIKGIAGPNTQVPIGYHISIVANSTYETVDNVGNTKIISKGDEVYSKYFDTSEQLIVEMLPSNIDLENNVDYTVNVTAAMNSGLTSQSSSNFTVSWTDEQYSPNAEIGYDKDTFTTQIHPYCEVYTLIFYKVILNSGEYSSTTEIVDIKEGIPIEINGEFVYTTTGDQVFSGTTTDGTSVYYCTIEEKNLVEDMTLSVYRREFDGTFTELASGINNTSNTFITDPHPALDYARYRIVAITNSTGSVSYYDIPGYPIGETSIIIQWDEEWSSFDTTNDDELEQPVWSGSLLKLPYNIDVSDSHSSDVSLVEYQGRKHPVSYYGTQLGETSSWSVEIDKQDKDTLYALRRLAIWMGNVYVREPSGSGYWATISVSFSQTHCEVTIPVTLDITRVEGGM